MVLLSADNPVIQDLLVALDDEELTDVTLEGHDEIPIPASRFLLAARSSVLRRMLYGNFLEANSSRILLGDYDSVILEAVVEYCYKNEISKFRLYIHRTASSARRLVQLYKAADYLDLIGLSKLVAQMAHNLTTRFPPLACAVYDEADFSTKVSRDALEMIRSRPYVTLPPDPETEGGISCLSEHKLLSIYKDSNIQAGELFLFYMLRDWLQCMQDGSSSRNNRNSRNSEYEEKNVQNYLDTVQACASYLVLENIEPHDLLTLINPSGFCDAQNITDAITKQALRASETRVWSLSSRGPDIERILVEGAGSKNANGIYYRIDGLANGELYSKREISCGQQYVYTLSISLNKSVEEVECRIFCSKLLTHKAIARLLSKKYKVTDARVQGDGNFQPILQVIDLEDDTDTSDTNLGSLSAPKIKLSDGEHYLYATLSNRMRQERRSKELSQNTLVKVLQYEKCIAVSDMGAIEAEQVYLKVTKLSIISQDPGHKFGNPAYYYDCCDDDLEMYEDGGCSSSSGSSLDDNNQAAMVVNPHPSAPIIDRTSLGTFMPPRESSRAALATPRRLFVSESQALHELYYCRYDIREKPIDSKVPSTEWIVDSHGIGPGPRCRWIPPADKVDDVQSDVIRNEDGVHVSTLSSDRKTKNLPQRTSSFNAFAASVLPLPVQSRYSLHVSSRSTMGS